MIESAAALEVRDLRARYGDKNVLKGIDLTVEPGEIFGLLGGNGAGKTTFVRTICGRLRPVAGTIDIAGQSKRQDLSRSIGLVPQEIALYPHLTVYENLQVFGRISGLSRAQTKAAIEEVGHVSNLHERGNDLVETLSGGWKRRANIAAAILHHPALLILDEPMVGVDLDARNSLESFIKRLSTRGMGILLVTHDLQQAESLCDRVGFLHDGVIAPQGAPRALLDAAFGAQSEIILEFGQRLAPVQEKVLHKLGFSSAGGAPNWSRVGEGSIVEVSAALQHAGLSPREIRLRRPGLDSLLLQLSHPVGWTAGEDAA